MDGEEGSENGGVGGECPEGAGAEARVAVEEEQHGGHAPGQGEECGVACGVEVEAATLERVGEEEGLAKREGEAFAGDGVDGAGGVPKTRNVADEGDVAASDAAEAAGEGEATAFGGDGLGGGEAGVERGEAAEDFAQPDAGVAGHGGDADFRSAIFFSAGGGDVGLSERALVHFDVGWEG